MQQLRINIRPILPFMFVWGGTVLVTMVVLTKFTGKITPILALPIAFVVTIIAHQFAKKILEGSILVSISNKTMHFEWERKPLVITQVFKEIQLQDITSYKYHDVRGFTTVKIVLKNGSNLKIECKTPNSQENTDLKKFIRQLKRISQENKYH